MSETFGLQNDASCLLASNIAALHAEIERLKKIDQTFNTEEFLPALLGTIQEGGVCVYDAQGNILSAWLPIEIQRRFGIDVSMLIGRSLEALHAPGVVTERMRLMREAVASGQTQSHEFYAQFPGGGFWFHATLSPLRDTLGQVKYVIAFFRDITRRKQAEAARDESEARYKGIVENTRDAIMLTRPDGIIDYLSPASLEVIGWAPEDLMGTMPDIFHPADRDLVFASLRHALGGGSGTGLDYRVVARGGEVRWISHSWSPIMEDGKVKMIVSVLRDIHEHKQLEERLRQTERLAAIGQTVADISHQLKTIVLNIRGSASMIQKSLEDNRTETLRKLWPVFQRCSDRLGNLAIGMLEYAGLETLNARPFDLNRLLREICQECVGKAARSSILILTRLDERIMAISGDPARLGEVFMNLISNSIEACEERRTGLIDVRTVWDEGRGVARVSIVDNGEGIPPEIQSRIFDPFFTTKGAKGTGLGLAIAHKVVQLHGGGIELDSRPGHTVATVSLPCPGPSKA